MITTSQRLIALALAFATVPVSVSAQDMDHSGHAGHQATEESLPMNDTAGAEDVLKAYNSAMVARDADAMAGLFAASSAIFENGKAEGSFNNYLEHHLGPELGEMTSFSFSEPMLSVIRNGHMAYGFETYGYRIELADGRVIERDGVATSVLAHDASGWKIVQYHSSSRTPRNR
tara:strand:- start:13329 stop:13850 length:522 start_codon:yes stop_codon:yes gene_type:complete